MNGFRQSFNFGPKGSLNWFPKHMNTGIKQMQAKLRSVDCIFEVHDSRIPFTGRNPTFAQKLVGNKPIIVVLNKCDLITHAATKTIRSVYNRTNNRDLIFTNSKNDQDPGVKKLVNMMKDLVASSERYNRTAQKEYHAMIIGIPNVGKSSLINILRARHMKKGRAVKVGPYAGVTKSVHEKVRICEDPPIFLFDTPGILTPRFTNPHVGMKMAVCGNLPDSQVGEEAIADYILYKMNLMENYKYVEHMGLDEPTDCITTVLAKGAIKLNYMQKMIQADNLKRAALTFIDNFRTGGYGKVLLDTPEDAVRFENSLDNFDPDSDFRNDTSLSNANEKFSRFS